MKKLLLLLFAFHFSLFTLSAQSWMWGKQGIGNAEGYSVATNSNGDAYLTGYFNETLIFNNYILNTGTNGEIFLVKYDNNGNVSWAIQSISNSRSNEYSNSVCVDKYGNAFIAGQIVDTVKLGLDTLITNILSAEMFIARIDSTGNVLWAKQTGGYVRSAGGGYAVTMDNTGNEYATGFFQDTTNFGAYVLRTPTGIGNIFLAKYDLAGNVTWAKQGIVNSGYAQGNGVSTDKWGNIYVTGIFSDTVSFGSTILTTQAGMRNIFLVKYDSTGIVRWAKQPQVAPANPYFFGYSVVTDNSGNIYITGSFKDTIYFDTIRLVSAFQDIFLTKYDSSGRVIWAKAASVLDGDKWIGYSLESDDSNYIYLSAGKNYSNPASLQFGNLTFNSNNSKDASVLIKFDSAGNALCGSILSSGGDDNSSVAVDNSGKYIYFGGDLESDTIIFGEDTLRIPIGYESPLVARWQGCNVVTNGTVVEKSNNFSTNVYPNPFTTSCIIYLPNNFYHSTPQFLLYTIDGRKVDADITFSSPHYILNRSQLSPGVYLLYTKLEDRTYYNKLVITD